MKLPANRSEDQKTTTIRKENSSHQHKKYENTIKYTLKYFLLL